MQTYTVLKNKNKITKRTKMSDEDKINTFKSHNIKKTVNYVEKWKQVLKVFKIMRIIKYSLDINYYLIHISAS